jgi:hypothetical protein
VPPVEQSQLRRLYSDYVGGIRDLELLEEVESRLKARAELVLDFTDLSEGEQGYTGDDPAAYDPSVVRLTGSNQLVHIDEEKDARLFDYDLQEAMQRLGVYYTDWGRDQLNDALDRIADARIGGDYDERMRAIDFMVHVTHGAGRIARMFIADEPMRAEYFLNALDLGTVPRRRPSHARGDRDVRVRRYRRQA